MSDMPLLEGDGDESSDPVVKRGGPPNRMNDLPYREWMKFQKSFFRHRSDQSLVEESVFFFTKAVWPDGTPSRALICGFSDFDPKRVPAPRLIEHVCPADMASIEGLLRKRTDLDFAFLDLRVLLREPAALSGFLKNHSSALFSLLKQAMKPDRYCAVAVDTAEEGGSGFPTPWAVAQASREHLRLRDEKVGLVESESRVFYCLYMQARSDERAPAPFDTTTLRYRRPAQRVPAWVIPKPPPRKKNEVLHPAKYPETLIEGFIELFTERGDVVLDPRVGTGSSVVAAIRKGRSGIGVDLSPKFAEIAKRRVGAEERERTNLFEIPGGKLTGRIVIGDATQLDALPDLVGQRVDYAVTSPPYWSMLTNPGSENQESRRKKDLPLVYSSNEADLGNIQDYDRFLELLDAVYTSVATMLKPGGVLTVVVKNIKRNHVLYPLAWDLTARLCGNRGNYDYIGNTLWCQDDVGLKPFAVGIHWVSNILHQYCLHFRRRKT